MQYKKIVENMVQAEVENKFFQIAEKNNKFRYADVENVRLENRKDYISFNADLLMVFDAGITKMYTVGGIVTEYGHVTVSCGTDDYGKFFSDQYGDAPLEAIGA